MTQQPNVGKVCVLSYYSSPLSFVGQGWGRLPLSFPSNTPCSPCHSMATGQTASDRIVCLHRRGNKDQGESGAGQRDLPPCVPWPYHQGEDRPCTGVRTRIPSPRYTFPVLLLTATAHKLTGNPISTARLSTKNLSRNFNQLELLDSTNLAPTLLLLPFLCYVDQCRF